ncbi:hypothetical protein [Sphingobium sp. BS19]|uniref:hypothetical protein n=1 Tax=Sphingobium sp. BS19 TaxID=3018973 RepID=UPI0024919707|nr:hypothetical protein [Sphingobium sp. BS19]
MMRELAVLFLHKGLVSERDILNCADQLDREGEADAAHNMRAILMHANVETASDFQATQARAQFHIVPDGGKAS